MIRTTEEDKAGTGNVGPSIASQQAITPEAGIGARSDGSSTAPQTIAEQPDAARAEEVHENAPRETQYHELPDTDFAVDVKHVSLWYGKAQALTDVSLSFPRNKVTALIGPSGCGKSTLLRCVNRMNDLVKGVRVEGRVLLDGSDVYAKDVDPVEVRRRVGMVFQRPNPFPRSIRENILYGAKINGYKGDYDALVEHSLKQAALWEEVQHDLKRSGLALSGGQQQRLCIARAVAISPDVILMDEPASALDPIATLKVEELMRELSANYTVIVVTHNLQQAARVSDYSAFMLSDHNTKGMLVEYGPTKHFFTNPRDKRTEDYITGRFG